MRNLNEVYKEHFLLNMRINRYANPQSVKMPQSGKGYNRFIYRSDDFFWYLMLKKCENISLVSWDTIIVSINTFRKKKHWTCFLLCKIMYRKTKNKMTVQYSQLYFLNLFCIIKVCIICFKLQSSFGDYIYSYAEKSISNLRKEEGAFLNACFWVCTYL